MNLEGLLRVASKVGTPLALAGIIVIILYALYKQVLALKLFTRIGADPTSRLLQNVLNKLFWLAIIALILGVTSYLLTALFPPSTPSHSSEDGNSRGITAGRDVLVNAPGGVMQTGPGSVVNQIQGIPPEEYARLAKELGVTQAALESFFKILEQQRVPPEDLDSKLREIAASYKRLQAQLQQFLSEDPAVMALRQQASQALEAGDFAQVETLLRQAQERDLQAIQEQQASLKKRQLSAAATSAELGALKNIQLAYAAAAAYYRQAAAVIPKDEAIKQAEYLNYEGMAWIAAGQYADAQPPLEHALALREKVLGPEHADVSASLNNLAALYHTLGRYADAEPRYQRALAIGEKVFGPEHPDVATTLNNLAELYRAQGRYAEAEPHYQRALAIREKVLGPEHPDVAMSLNNLAELYRAQGRYAEAEPHYQRALAIVEKVLGPEHPNVATSLNNLAGSTMPRAGMPRRSRTTSGRWPSGRRCSARSIPTWPRASTTWLQLYHAQGRYADAEPHYQRALAIREKVLGPEHPDVATSLNNLAVLYRAQGRYADAEPRYQRALAIREKVLGPEHPDVATSLNNLAALYHAQGRYADAEPHYQRALAIREKVLGPEHPDVAMSLNNLAELYRAQGRYADAEPRYQRALAIREKVLGPEHPDVATSLNNLALLYHAQGRYADAEPALPAGTDHPGEGARPEHPDVATSLNNLAGLYHTQGRYADAEPRYQRALAIREKVLGPEHPGVAMVVRNYVTLLRTTNREAEAAQLEAQWQARQPPRAWLGIQMKLSTDPPGVIVEQVIAESPAAQAGLQPHDVIILFDGQEVFNPQTLLRLVGTTTIGTTIDVDIIHDGQRRTIPVTLEQRLLSSP